MVSDESQATSGSEPTFRCTCASDEASGTPDGLVLLFYRYWAAAPRLPARHRRQTHELAELAGFHHALTQAHGIQGKIRIAPEGFNVTVAGARAAIESYIEGCAGHWSFAGLGLMERTEAERADGLGDVQRRRLAFFKPSPGCACVFPGPASVRITAEVTPLGITAYTPRDWTAVGELSPEAFHDACLRLSTRSRSIESSADEPNTKEDASLEPDEELVLLDLRNHYESRIGYFIDPATGEPGFRPPIRRFSQFPAYARRTFEASGRAVPSRRRFLTYCTGGVRCEKGARWLQEAVVGGESDAAAHVDEYAPELDDRTPEGADAEANHISTPVAGDQVFTLKGGIAAYLTWMEQEIATGRRTPDESLFKGRNYVFDLRGSLGLHPPAITHRPDLALPPTEHVSTCHVCHTPSSGLGACAAPGCRLVLVICAACASGGLPAWCCTDCRALDGRKPPSLGDPPPRHRPMCACEREREARLLAGGSRKVYVDRSRRRREEKPRAVVGRERGRGGRAGEVHVDVFDLDLDLRRSLFV